MRAVLAAGDHQRWHFGRERRDPFVEILDPGQRRQFVLVGKENVDQALFNQRAEIITVSCNHETV